MKTMTLTVDSADAVKRRMKAAFAGRAQGARISFESLELLWRVLAPNRMALVRVLAGAGALTLREVARRAGRDVRAVHADVHRLLEAGVLRRTEAGLIEFPFDAVHVDFVLEAA